VNAGGFACRDQEHRPRWYAPEPYSNRSAFNGYHWTPSDYSAVFCPLCPAQTGYWRTKADYVATLPTSDPGPAG
jgi:hypothetical protein